MIALHLAVLATASQVVRPSPRTNALLLAGYGAVVVLAHRAVGFTGDENGLWSLFDQGNDFPGDFGRNVFPGSIGLGVIMLVLGVGVAALASRVSDARLAVGGWVLLVVSMLALVFVAAPRVDGWLGLRPTSIAMFLVVAFTLISPRPEPDPQ
jgi:hypothetical protein